MQFLVMMRDGSRFGVEADYLEVVSAEASTYTLLGPVPGYERAILATFPIELVTAILPYDQIDQFTQSAEVGRPSSTRRSATRPSRTKTLHPQEAEAIQMSGWSES